VNGLIAGSDTRITAMLDSYECFLGVRLCEPGELFAARCIVLAHGTQAPPILFYGNQAALQLWEMSWQELTAMPSFRTAEPDLRQDRARLLEDVQRQGFSTDYSGVRVSSSGRRFQITDATVWNILDADGLPIGQAATFRDHRPVAD